MLYEGDVLHQPGQARKLSLKEHRPVLSSKKKFFTSTKAHRFLKQI